MLHVPIRDLKDRLSEYLRLVAEGEEIVITLHKRPIAKLTPMGEAPEGEADLVARLNSLPWIRAGNGKSPQGSRNIARPHRSGKCVSDLLASPEGHQDGGRG
jgi:prevent-host-death family protein